MAILPVELLKKLGSGVRPGEAQRPRSASGDAGQIDFASMIRAARAGQVRSDRAVSWERTGREDPVDRAITVIEEALDRAEAAGVDSVIVALDGRLLRADVATRALRDLQSEDASVLSLDGTAFLVINTTEDEVGPLADLAEIESGTESAKRVGAMRIGWISNRSLGEIVATAESASDAK